MDLYYLSENIYIKNNKLYLERNNKCTQVTKYNWHKILCILGWMKLPRAWIIKLNKLNKYSQKNSLYGILECGSDGDCLFNCICYALNSQLLDHDKYYTSYQLRQELVDHLTVSKFEKFMEYYQLIYIDSYQSWNPYKITIDEFKQELLNSDFWGDHLIINELMNILHINIIVLLTNEFESKYMYYHTFHDYNKKNPSIVLNYINNNHFKLIGHFENGMMVTYFNNLPDEIYSLIRRC